MFRHIDRRSVANFLKDAVKRGCRRVLGLDVRLARSRQYDLQPYDQNVKQTTRFLHFQSLLADIADIEGHIVECGVGPGRSLFEFAVISQALGVARRLIGYDTFEGLPDPTPVDGPWNRRIGGYWFYSREHVRRQLVLAGLAESFVAEHIALVPGDLKDSLPGYDEGPIAFLHIDVDIYESYKVALECLYDHVVPGGVIAFDEYAQANWPGATKAIDEFFADKPETVVRSSLAERYCAVKCG